MKVTEIFESNKEVALNEAEIIASELVEEILEEGLADNEADAVTLLESNISKTVSNYAARYNSRNPPEIIAYQDPENKNHVAVLAAGDNMYFRFDIISGRVVSEERFSSFKEMMDEKELLMAARYYPIDHRSWLAKNWKKILMWLGGGTAGVLLGGPLIVAILATVSTFLSWAASGVVMAGSVVAGGWVLKKIGERQP